MGQNRNVYEANPSNASQSKIMPLGPSWAWSRSTRSSWSSSWSISGLNMFHTLIGFHTLIAARAYDLLHQLMPFESADEPACIATMHRSSTLMVPNPHGINPHGFEPSWNQPWWKPSWTEPSWIETLMGSTLMVPNPHGINPHGSKPSWRPSWKHPWTEPSWTETLMEKQPSWFQTLMESTLMLSNSYGINPDGNPHEPNPHGLKPSWNQPSWFQTLMESTLMVWYPHGISPHGYPHETNPHGLKPSWKNNPHGSKPSWNQPSWFKTLMETLMETPMNRTLMDWNPHGTTTLMVPNPHGINPHAFKLSWINPYGNPHGSKPSWIETLMEKQPSSFQTLMESTLICRFFTFRSNVTGFCLIHDYATLRASETGSMFRVSEALRVPSGKCWLHLARSPFEHMFAALMLPATWRMNVDESLSLAFTR